MVENCVLMLNKFEKKLKQAYIYFKNSLILIYILLNIMKVYQNKPDLLK